MVQTAASIVLIGMGLYVALADNTGELRFFGWLVAVIGVLALIARAIIAARRDDRGP